MYMVLGDFPYLSKAYESGSGPELLSFGVKAVVSYTDSHMYLL